MDEATAFKLTGTYISAGTIDAGEIYTGSTWLDRYSRQAILSQPVGYYSLPGSGHLATYVRTGGSMRFYGPALHGSSPLGQRVRGSQYGGALTFILNASCTADHYFSLWYRINGNDYWVPPVYTTYCVTYEEGGEYCWTEQTGGGYVASTAGWNWISKTVEPQNDFGTAAVAGSVSLWVPNSTWWVDFGITITDENYSVMNEPGTGKNNYVRDMYMYAFAVNV